MRTLKNHVIMRRHSANLYLFFSNVVRTLFVTMRTFPIFYCNITRMTFAHSPLNCVQPPISLFVTSVVLIICHPSLLIPLLSLFPRRLNPPSCRHYPLFPFCDRSSESRHILPSSPSSPSRECVPHY